MILVSDEERRNTLVTLPKPVDERLELLIRVARAKGVKVSRSQMLAAMVTSTPPGRVRRMVENYLAMTLETFSAQAPAGALPEVKQRGRQRSN